jgi:hypothetical protein
MSTLFPNDNESLRRAAWRGHLGHDAGPSPTSFATLLAAM